MQYKNNKKSKKDYSKDYPKEDKLLDSNRNSFSNKYKNNIIYLENLNFNIYNKTCCKKHRYLLLNKFIEKRFLFNPVRIILNLDKNITIEDILKNKIFTKKDIERLTGFKIAGKVKGNECKLLYKIILV